MVLVEGPWTALPDQFAVIVRHRTVFAVVWQTRLKQQYFDYMIVVVLQEPFD